VGNSVERTATGFQLISQTAATRGAIAQSHQKIRDGLDGSPVHDLKPGFLWWGFHVESIRQPELRPT
jgi:hypothetical protein